MADINQVITLGIGTPSDIAHFILVGLPVNPSGVVAPTNLWDTPTAAAAGAESPFDTVATQTGTSLFGSPTPRPGRASPWDDPS